MISGGLFYAFPENAYYFYALLIGAVFVISIIFLRKKAVDDYSSKLMTPYVTNERSLLFSLLKALLAIILIFLSCFAALGPQVNPHYPEGEKNIDPLKKRLRQDEVVLLVDASASMTAPDASSQKTRFDEAKEIAGQIVNRLRGERVSVYAFTVEPVEVSPSSYDRLFAKMMIEALVINEGGLEGTDLLNSLDLLFEKKFKKQDGVHRSIIILTDGGDKETNTAAKLATIAKKYSSSLFDVAVVGTGSVAGARLEKGLEISDPPLVFLNEDFLKQLAAQVNGFYFHASDFTPLHLSEELYNLFFRYPHFSSDEATFSKQAVVYDNYMFYPLLGAIIALLIILILPDKKGVLFFLPLIFIPLEGIEKRQIDLAITYAQAGGQESAKKQLSQLASIVESPFEESVVFYNIGVIDLSERDLKNALAAFRKALLNKKSLPSNFLSSLYFNLSLTEALLAKASFEKGFGYEALALLEISKKDLSLHEKSACQFEEMIGKKACEKSPFSLQLEAFIASLEEQLPKDLKAPMQWDLLVKLAKEESDVEKMLEKMVLLVSILPEEPSKKSIDDLLDLSFLFLQKAIKKQQEGYAEGVCQSSPWRAVLPAFFEGELALRHIGQDDMENDFSFVQERKAQVINAWEKAIAAFKDRSSSSSSCFGSDSSENEEKSSENSLQELQQMIKNDQVQKSIKPVKQPGIKPW